MNRLREQAERWLAERRRAVIVEIVDSAGSVPRETGTRLLVDATEVAGTIGGGRLEFEAIGLARAALATGQPFVRRFALGPSLGQCCGGAVTLRGMALDAGQLRDWPVEAPLFRLQVYGAGHVGREIVRLLERLPVQVDWIDERDDEFAIYRQQRQAEGAGMLPPHLRTVVVDAVHAEVATACAGGFFLVLTHSHDLDLAICEAILRRGDFGFLGLIGSRTKRARFVARFRERGLPAERIARLTCPIGLAGIRSKRPESIAIAVVAQLLAQPSAQDGSARNDPGIQAELPPHTTPEETP